MAYKDKDDARRWYAEHREQEIAKAKIRNEKIRSELRSYINELRAKTPCLDCGVSYPHYVMDFDHRNPSEKTKEVTNIVTSNSWKKLFAEIEKCDIVCSNCHRERTWGRA